MSESLNLRDLQIVELYPGRQLGKKVNSFIQQAIQLPTLAIHSIGDDFIGFTSSSMPTIFILFDRSDLLIKPLNLMVTENRSLRFSLTFGPDDIASIYTPELAQQAHTLNPQIMNTIAKEQLPVIMSTIQTNN